MIKIRSLERNKNYHNFKKIEKRTSLTTLIEWINNQMIISFSPNKKKSNNIPRCHSNAGIWHSWGGNPPIIPVPSNFPSVFRFSFSFKSQICTGRTEIRCLNFHFLQNANLDTQICPNFLKCVRKSIHTWENLDRYVCVSRFAIWRKWKSEHTYENLDV